MPEDFAFSVDSDWKKQAQEEKRRLAEEAERQRASTPPPAATAPSAGAASAVAAPAGAPGARRRRGRMPGARDEPPEASFQGLVQTLAGQALLYLGGVALANGEGLLDLDTAKHHIDLLAVLEEKTRGSLSSEEQQALDVALYETRMRFVSVASRYIL